MIFLVISLILVEVVTAQYKTTTANQLRPPAEPKKVFYKAAPLHYVNIGAQLAGDYQFGYDTGKGPMGQSFREEVRLADGSVQGSYGVIDELGHKRVVHYTSGRGGSLARNGNTQLSSQFNSIDRQSQSLRPNLDILRQQIPVFDPANYLQARVIPLQYSSQNLMQLKKPERRPTPADDIENRLPDITLPLYRTPERSPLSLSAQKDTQAASAAGYAQQHTSAPEYVPKASFVEYEQKASVPSTIQKTPVPVQAVMGRVDAKRPQALDARDKQSRTSGDAYKSQIKRVTKKPSARFQRTQTKAVVDEPAYTTAEIDYYDSVPAFIDIERLSYDIGSSRNKA